MAAIWRVAGFGSEWNDGRSEGGRACISDAGGVDAGIQAKAHQISQHKIFPSSPKAAPKAAPMGGIGVPFGVPIGLRGNDAHVLKNSPSVFGKNTDDGNAPLDIEYKDVLKDFEGDLKEIRAAINPESSAGYYRELYLTY